MPDSHAIPLGEFTLVEAPRVVAQLDAAGISYEYEFDDTEIKRLSIAEIVIRGGTAGLGQKIMIYVSEDDLDAANAIVARLYPI